ncbi:scarecrow-like protein 27 [Cornus florida]|uniref:scarecrow-like protein 27 n=1 Tax=Cornus florida TaxID=4283 RepID=UPI00289D60FA|nr:scarecrow-like protein 27 [Cornus florida]
MRGMQYNLQGKVSLEVAGLGSLSSLEPKWKKEGSCGSNKPISVLDIQRSPSPSTSTSTLSSSFGSGRAGDGCGSGSTEYTVSVAAVSDNNPHQKWPVSMSPETGPGAVTESLSATTVGDGGGRKDELGVDLQPIPYGLEVSGLEDWESLLSESGQDQSLLRWISGDADDTSFGLKQLLQGDGNVVQSSGFGPVSAGGSTGILSAACGSEISSNDNDNRRVGSTSMVNCKGPNFGLNNSNPQNSISTSLLNNLPPGVVYQQQEFQTPDEKPQIFNPQLFMNQQMLSQPQPKRQNLGVVDPHSEIPKVAFVDPNHEFLLPKHQQQLPPQLGLAQQMQLLPPYHPQQKPLMLPKQDAVGGSGDRLGARHHHHHQQQQQVIYDQLYKAAELILAGNFTHAHMILARLNHQLSPAGKPFQRAAFYFKEALQLLLMPNSVTSLPPANSTPFDGMFKMGAYKVFSEVSPLIHFVNFTSNQALLDALGDADRVHIIDFDVGFGAQWASFMQELPGRNRGTLSLKITAFASPSTHHPTELGLMHENLTQFANEIGISFELEVVNFETFDPNSYSMHCFQSPENEAIVVNFPIWSCSSRLSVLPSLLRFIKQLSPKLMVSLERGCERMDLPFSHHLLHGLQYHEVVFDSIDAANLTSDTMAKIERFLFLPRIESTVLGRLSAPDKMIHWKALFASAGFSPVAFSNFAETQAECVVKRTPGRGYHVEKRQASLNLCWQHRELMSVSAWRC